MRAMAPYTFAHRGGSDGGWPENSLLAFRDALGRGCEIETDARLSADGQVVLMHDAIRARGWRPMWPSRMSAARLARLGVPTLDELYRELGTDYQLSVDLKAPAAAGPAMAVARAAGALRRLWLVSDDVALLASIRREEPDVRLVHEARHDDLASKGVPVEQHLAHLAGLGVDAANTTAGRWTPSLVEHAAALGLAAFGSLLQQPAAMARAVELGLDGFYSDHLAAMRTAVEAGSR